MDLSTGNNITKPMAGNVALVSSKGPYGNDVMACQWATRCSFSPAMFVISIGKERATYDNILSSKEFGISIAATDQNILTSVVGGNSARDTDKIAVLKELGFKFYKAKKINVLMIKDSSVNFECKLVNKIETGDHILLVGEIVEASSSGNDSLIYSAGKFWKLGENLQKPNSEYLEKIRKIVEKHRKSSA